MIDIRRPVGSSGIFKLYGIQDLVGGQDYEVEWVKWNGRWRGTARCIESGHYGCVWLQMDWSAWRWIPTSVTNGTVDVLKITWNHTLLSATNTKFDIITGS